MGKLVYFSTSKQLSIPRKTIGLLIDWLASTYHTQIFAGVLDFCKERDLDFVCFGAGDYAEREEGDLPGNVFYKMIDPRIIDGVVITAASIGNIAGREAMQRLIASYSDLPVVTIGDTYDQVPSVLSNNTKAMNELVSHLIEDHGLTRIGFISGPNGNSESQLRLEAYMDCLEKHRLAFHPEWFYEGDFVIESGREAVRHLLKNAPPGFEALVCANDSMAIGAIEELRLHGFAVPEDVVVTGFDNVDLSRTLELTTVSQPMYEAGWKAAETVLGLMRLQGVPETTIIDNRLILRQSCGCFGQTANPVSPVPRKKPSRRSSSRTPEGIGSELMRLWKNRFEEGGSNTFLLEWKKRLLSHLSEHSSLNLLRRFVPLLEADSDPNNPEDDEILQKAQDLLEEALQRSWTYRKIFFEDYQLEKINIIGELLVNSLDWGDEMDVLYRELPTLGIRQGYIVLYENTKDPFGVGRLILAYDEDQRYPIEKPGMAFPVQRFLPPGILPRERPYHLVVQSLHNGMEPLGYMVLDWGEMEMQTHEILRNKISFAFKSAALMEKVRHQAEMLEDEVQKRTRELMTANENLLKEIQEREHIEIQLKKSEERFREMAFLLPTILIETDRHLHFTFLNKEAQETFGIDPTRPAGNLKTLIHPDDRQGFEYYIDDLIAVRQARFGEFRLQLTTGEVLHLLWKAGPLWENGLLSGVRFSALNVKGLLRSVVSPEEDFFKHYRFSPRVLEVLELILQGHDTREIAAKLKISENTVKAHIRSIYLEVGVKNRKEFFEVVKEYQVKTFGPQSYIFTLLGRLFKE